MAMVVLAAGDCRRENPVRAGWGPAFTRQFDVDGRAIHATGHRSPEEVRDVRPIAAPVAQRVIARAFRETHQVDTTVLDVLLTAHSSEEILRWETHRMRVEAARLEDALRKVEVARVADFSALRDECLEHLCRRVMIAEGGARAKDDGTRFVGIRPSLDGLHRTWLLAPSSDDGVRSRCSCSGRKAGRRPAAEHGGAL